MTLYATMFGRIHPAGRRIVLGAFAVAVVLTILFPPLGLAALVVSLFSIYFFRDPVRVVPEVADALVSPADGIVAAIGKVAPPAELDLGTEPRTRISIFLSVIHVHVNRIPADGHIRRCLYRPGRFVNASLDKASEENERQSVVMDTADGHTIAFVQIAGLIARRIICHLSEGQKVTAGERFGLIRFGSRVDVYLDRAQEPRVLEGQTVIGGETVIAGAPQRGVTGKGRRE